LNYRYQPISQNMLSGFPYSIFRMLDKESTETIEKSPWEIICDQTMLAQIDSKYYPMICAAATDNGIKDRREMRKELKKKFFKELLEHISN